MDNATWHIYSPEFNPIERVWSFLKSKVRQQFFSKANDFREFVYQLLNEINSTSSKQLAHLCCSFI